MMLKRRGLRKGVREMSDARTCWIDQSKCYVGTATVALENCRLCQRVRLAKRAIAKGETVTWDI